MIADQPAALRALQAVLVQLRWLAYQREPHERLAELLDCAEYLPQLLADPDDRTREFRDALADLARRHAGFTLALDRFDAP